MRAVSRSVGGAARSVSAMAELKSRLRADLTDAMKTQDKLRTATLRMLLAAIQTEEVSGKEARELSDDEVLKVLARESRKRNEAAEIYTQNGRGELAANEHAEARVIDEYLPTPLSEAELAEVVGMPAKRLRNICFIVGSALVGVSALLIGLNVGIIDFNMGSDIILMATVAMIIGGLGNVGAAAGGGFVLGMTQNVAIWKIESKWQMALSFAILIAVLLFKPSGLFGEKRPAAGL